MLLYPKSSWLGNSARYVEVESSEGVKGHEWKCLLEPDNDYGL